MKNKTISFVILTVVILTSACGKNELLSIDAGDIIVPGENPIIDDAPSTNNGPCDNIFYPMALDNQWIYQFKIEGEGGNPELSELGLTVAEVYDSNATLGALDYDTGFVTKSTVVCNNGAILNFPMTELSLVFGEIAGDIILEYTSGIFMPSESDLEAGGWTNTWETEFTANGVVSGIYENNTATVNLSDSPVSMEWQLSEKDLSLQVPAGIFNNVVLIKRKLTFDVSSLKATVEGQDLDLSTTLVFNTNMWYAPFVGLLKQEIDTATINLYGINFPIESIGTVELKSSNLVK